MNKQKLRDYIGWGVVSLSVIIIALFLLGVLPTDNARNAPPSPEPSVIVNEPSEEPGETASPDPSAEPEAIPTPEPAPEPEEAYTPTVLTHKPTGEPKIEYDVSLTLYEDLRRLHGMMRVSYTNTSPNEQYELVFRLHPNAYKRIDSPCADPKAYPNMTFSSGQVIISAVSLNNELNYHTISDDEYILRVPFNKPLLPGEQTEALIELAIDVPTVNARFGYTALGYQLGNFLPVLAVYQDGAWVEHAYYGMGDSFYAEVADYTVTLKYPEQYTLASTGQILSEKSSDGLKTSVVQAEKARDFSCMLTKGLRVNTSYHNETKIISYALSQASADNAAAIATRSLALYEELLGDYPYPTLTIAQAELYNAGGMEYSSFMMIQREQYLNGRELDLEYTVAHETAHQYFYALVGSDQVDSPFVDEAITTYFALLPIERRDQRAFERLKTTLMSVNGAKRMDEKLSFYANPQEYAASIYWRGSLMYDNLRALLGDDIFFAALKAYIQAHSYKIAVKQDLINAFEKTSGRDLEQFFYEWMGEAEVRG